MKDVSLKPHRDRSKKGTSVLEWLNTQKSVTFIKHTSTTPRDISNLPHHTRITIENYGPKKLLNGHKLKSKLKTHCEKQRPVKYSHANILNYSCHKAFTSAKQSNSGSVKRWLVCMPYFCAFSTCGSWEINFSSSNTPKKLSFAWRMLHMCSWSLLE